VDAAEPGDLHDDPVETLRRWEAAGALWRVLGDSGHGLTVGLFSCDGGEEMSRFTSDDPALVAFVDGADGADGADGTAPSA
jgi:hypothetical protein